MRITSCLVGTRVVCHSNHFSEQDEDKTERQKQQLTTGPGSPRSPRAPRIPGPPCGKQTFIKGGQLHLN